MYKAVSLNVSGILVSTLAQFKSLYLICCALQNTCTFFMPDMFDNLTVWQRAKNLTKTLGLKT